MSEAKLKEVLNFDEADIGANRMGKLTEKQKKLLGEKFTKNKNLYLFIGFVIVFMFVSNLLSKVIPAILKTVGTETAEGTISLDSIMPILPFIAMGVVFLLIFGFIIVLVLRVVFGKATRQADMTVRRAEGKVNFVWVEREERNLSSVGTMFKKVRSLEMRVGEDNNFTNVNSELPNLMNQDEKWIVYYVNHPFKILSAEKSK